jgi:hypothetical protein
VTPGPGDVGVDEPLPAPTSADAGTIGQGLYNPAETSTAVVSLLDRVGVEIRSDDGSVLRSGSDQGAGLVSMSETEVRGLIDMTREDLKGAQTDTGVGPITIRQLFDGIHAMFPAGYAAEAFADAFDSAYRDGRDGLAAGVMLGMPITPDTRLLRVQAWLLLLDAFPAAEPLASGKPTAAAIRYTVPRAGQALRGAAGGGLGAAALNLPTSTSPVPGWTPGEWRGMLRILPTLAYRVAFTTTGTAPVHEGHGRLGDRWDIDAFFGRGGDISNPRTGVALLSGTYVGAGLEMKWNSNKPGVLADHGQVRNGLNVPVMTDGNGEIHNGYQAKREDSNGRGELVHIDGNLYAEVKQLDLVRAAYRIPAELDTILDCDCLITGIRRTPHPDFDIGWHEEDVLDITIENYYDYKISIIPGEIYTITRKGKDVAKGTLALNKDGTYSGIMHATSSGTASGSALLGLAGVVSCGNPDVSTADQDLYVVGQKVGTVSMVLRFFPASTPAGTFTICQAPIDYPGDDILGQAAGKYIPLNDNRWQNPDVGIEIPIPGSPGNVIDQYEDPYVIQPENKFCSAYYFTVIWPDPKTGSIPLTRPPFTHHLCE